MKPLFLDDYFSRIGLSKEPQLNETGLVDLQKGQFFTFPFENLDIHLGKKISVEIDAIFEKLVHNKRGGYCFELNGLMLYVLKTLGFKARPLLARVHLEREPGGRTHQLNLIELNGRKWIVDVGFGAGGLRSPLPLEEGVYKQESGMDIKLSKKEPWGWFMQTKDKGVWKDSYSFDLGHVIKSDILLGNHFTSTSELTHFTHFKTASLPLPNGRISLKDTTITRLLNGKVSTEILPRNNDYLFRLKDYFGIELDVDYIDFKSLY